MKATLICLEVALPLQTRGVVVTHLVVTFCSVTSNASSPILPFGVAPLLFGFQLRAVRNQESPDTVTFSTAPWLNAEAQMRKC